MPCLEKLGLIEWKSLNSHNRCPPLKKRKFCNISVIMYMLQLFVQITITRASWYLENMWTVVAWFLRSTSVLAFHATTMIKPRRGYSFFWQISINYPSSRIYFQALRLFVDIIIAFTTWFGESCIPRSVSSIRVLRMEIFVSQNWGSQEIFTC